LSDKTDMNEEKLKSEQAPDMASDANAAEKAGDKETAGDENIVKSADEKIEDQKKEAEKTYERLQRVSADFENYKKRAARDVSELRKYANETLLKELLTVADNLERAVDSLTDKKGTAKEVLEGVELTLGGIFKIFEKFHVTPLESVGKPFDPCFHEAMMREPTNECGENTVVKEMQKGYMIHERLLRPALVVVSAPAPEKCA
jgi:molecular chaperone GrpE